MATVKKTAKKTPAKKSATKKAAPTKNPPKKTALKKTGPRKTAAKQASAKSLSSKSAQSLVDEQLARYREMRNFGVTTEPSGKATAKTKPTALPFVIQKHAASHLHYDFRLGWNGVLKSWAVAKGPSYSTKDRRLAVQVEDHPIEYGGFEGIIPKGQYGGGTVMVWDQGTWAPQPGHEDIDEGLANGTLKFTMNGSRMHGKWTLVRMNKFSGSKPQWLLIKEHDDFERGPDDPCITDEEPNSAVTGRSLDQIAAGETHVWNSNRTNKSGTPWQHGANNPSDESVIPSNAKNLLSTAQSASVTKLPEETLPEFIPPQLAQHVAQPPEGADWLHELKLDGYRIQARKHKSTVGLRTRSGLDWTHRMKPVAEALRALNAETAILDGEVVVLDDEGNSSFAKLQASFEQVERHPLTYFAFDLLHLNGHNTRNLPLTERKALLAKILPSDSSVIRLNEHIEGLGADVFHQACDLHAEGILSKRVDAKYSAGRASTWVKSKCVREQEFVIGGFTHPTNGTYGIGALLLGYYDDGGKLIYAGRTGTGFTQKTHRLLRDKLEALQQKSLPFNTIPSVAKRDAHWVKPDLVAQVHFATWTAENLVRQAAYLGLREDKAAAEVRRELPSTPPQPKRGKRDSYAAEEETPTPSKTKTQSAPAKKATTAAADLPIRLTHPDKILDKVSGLTKLNLAEYYFAVAEHMLPHIAGRPLSLVRCPEGSTGECFYQKHVNHMLPPGIGSVMVTDKKSGKPEPYITLDTPEALAGLAQIGVLEVHPWGSRNNDLEHPDRIIIDLDPDPTIPWQQLAQSAKDIRAMLKSIGIESFLKTTGGKGLHLVFPIEPKHTWDTVKLWARAFATEIERSNPDLYLIKMTKAARKNRIFIDYLRNERGATAVSPFSPRAREGAPVSVPLAWKELDLDTRPTFSIRNFTEWQSRLKNDPWKKLNETHQTLPGFEEEAPPSRRKKVA